MLHILVFEMIFLQDQKVPMPLDLVDYTVGYEHEFFEKNHRAVDLQQLMAVDFLVFFSFLESI